MIRFEYSEAADQIQDLEYIGLAEAEIVELSCCRRAIGFWRSDLQSGHLYWTKGVFEIYGMEYARGPVNLTAAYGAVHGEDLHYMLELLERAASHKCGFHFVLRLKDGQNGFKHVRSIARFRVASDGREELVGSIEEIPAHVRQVEILGGSHT